MKVEPVRVSNPEEWIKINTFECDLGRVSPEECELLRQRVPYSKRYEASKSELIMPKYCEKCERWKELSEKVYKKRKLYSKGGSKMGKIIVCDYCGGEKTLYAKNLCSACYKKIYNRQESLAVFVAEDYISDLLRGFGLEKGLDKVILFCNLIKRLIEGLKNIDLKHALDLVEKNEGFKFIEEVSGSDLDDIESSSEIEEVKRKLWFILRGLINNHKKEILKDKLQEYEKLKQRLKQLEEELKDIKIL